MKKKTIRIKIKEGILYIISFWPFLLSHHPDCKHFNNHTLNVSKKIHLCIGCFIGYPTAILGILLIPILKINELIPMNYYLLISIVLLSTIVLSFLNLIKNKTIKIIQKFLIGLGSSFLFWYIITRPNPREVNRLILNISFGTILSVLNLYHVLGFILTCYKCETPFSWGACGGLESVIRNIEKYELRNIFLSFEDFSNSILERREKKS